MLTILYTLSVITAATLTQASEPTATSPPAGGLPQCPSSYQNCQNSWNPPCFNAYGCPNQISHTPCAMGGCYPPLPMPYGGGIYQSGMISCNGPDCQTPPMFYGGMHPHPPQFPPTSPIYPSNGPNTGFYPGFHSLFPPIGPFALPGPLPPNNNIANLPQPCNYADSLCLPQSYGWGGRWNPFYPSANSHRCESVNCNP
ncbi:hypothetical protein AB6A40_007489 [Gnathostoma spinigerum]|uniref:Uncharacterized protein n=1 Tax=Gnathostoma spinigerum TaxID=75299 RepID=A0ABD6ELD1_9BILA